MDYHYGQSYFFKHFSFPSFFLLTKVVAEKHYLRYGLIAIAILSLFTSISWTVCQVMPDIFTSVAFISMTLILLEKFSKKIQLLLYFIFFISISMHISHLLMFSLLIIILFVLKSFILKPGDFKSSKKHLAILFTLTAISIITMGSALFKSKHVFFMGAMVEHGITKKYLDDNCGVKNYKLCAYKDSLPQKAYQFVWDEKSPLYKIGGWKDSKKEFNEIIYGTLTDRKYIKMHIQESAKATIDQLSKFDIGEGNASFLQGTLLYERIAKYFQNDISYYAISKQNQSKLSGLRLFNSVFYFVIILSSIFLLFFSFIIKNIFTNQIKVIFFIFCMGILINAWDCGTFANAIERLGCKVIWLIPFAFLLLLLKVIVKRKT